jgi:hypothetical protein
MLCKETAEKPQIFLSFTEDYRLDVTIINKVKE